MGAPYGGGKGASPRGFSRFYQWTPLKHACLSKCRFPLGFVLNEWREGRRGAFLMGLKHGGYCTGCCWSLMALLFVAGVMNLLWVAAIAGFVLIEKVAPGGDRLGRVAGVALAGWGAWMVAGALRPFPDLQRKFPIGILA